MFVEPSFPMKIVASQERKPCSCEAKATQFWYCTFAGSIQQVRWRQILENTFTCPRFDVILSTYQSYIAQQNSFDIVSQVDRAEVTNAIHQTVKEVRQRFDFKGSNANVALEENDLVLSAEDETKLRNMNDIFQQKLVRRGVPLKALSYGT